MSEKAYDGCTIAPYQVVVDVLARDAHLEAAALRHLDLEVVLEAGTQSLRLEGRRY